MEIKFNVYFKKNLGTLCKNNEIDLDGKEAYVNIDLYLVDRLEVNYAVGNNKYTDEVTIKDVQNKEILIPFKSDVVKPGVNEFEIVAYMKNGDIKVSQTYTYSIERGIGEGQQVGTGIAGDGHTHFNLNILNSITQSKIDGWDNKADKDHIHDDYLKEYHLDGYAKKSSIPTKISQLTNDSNYVNESYVTNKIAEAQLSGDSGEIDLSAYVTKEVGNASQITFSDGKTFQEKLDTGELQGPTGLTGPQGPTGKAGIQGPKGDQGSVGPQGERGLQGIQGAKGEDGISISEIHKTGSSGLVDTYTITYSNGSRTTFTITNGAKGEVGPQGEKGAQGLQGERGLTGERGPKGETGERGEKGDTPDMSNYYSKNQTDLKIKEEIANASLNKDEVDLSAYATKTYVVEEIQKIELTPGEKGDVGPQGPQGPKGDQGIQGPKGERGLTGETGPQGPTGEKGTDGVSISTIQKTGTVGLVDTYTVTYSNATQTTFNVTNGAKGETGVTGPQGKQGETGPQGIQGERGPIGPKGDPGEQGPQGPRGEQGADGVSVSKIQKTSTSGLVDTYTIAYSNGNQTTFTVTNGAKGEQGIQGPVGPAGATGERGLTGLQGEQGPRGLTGATGPQGAEGKSAYQIALANNFVGSEAEWLKSLKGEPGVIGGTGPKGDTGERGPKGEQGIQGPKGDTGPIGPQGDRGLQGEQGPRGLTGATGVGLVTGGTTGQVLVKKSNTDYDTQWVTIGANDTWSQIYSSGSYLRLNTHKYQYIQSMSSGTEIVLPSVSGNSVVELHLFFHANYDITLVLPSCKWQTIPEFKLNKSYELIFTHFDGMWLGGVVVYE